MLELLNRPCPGGDSAVGDEAHRLVAPLVMQVVDRVLQRGRIAVVVLRGDEDDGISSVNDGAPGMRVVLGVLTQPGMFGLVEEWQGELRQIDHLQVKAAVLGRLVGEPAGDRQPDAARAGAGDDDQQGGHGAGI